MRTHRVRANLTRASLLALLAGLVGVAAADVTVDTIADADVDDAACSLREAIVAVNTNADYHGCVRSAATVDQISFDIGAGTPTIAVTGSDLPSLTGPTIIDGATGGATRVEIAGGGSFATGIGFTGGPVTGSAVKHLVINGFTARELFISNGIGVVVTGNLLGCDKAGMDIVAGGGRGIELCAGFGCGTSSGHQIGGPTSDERNVIVGVAGPAIEVGTSGTVIKGNWINTNGSGSQPISLEVAGIALNNVADTQIGGPNEGERNIITGSNGIVVGGNPAGARSSGTIIQGNYIGLDVTGTDPIGGGGDGIVLSHAIDTLIGGTVAGAGNKIAAFHVGISGGSSGVSGGVVGGTTVQGNAIGVNRANSSHGIALGDDALIEGNVIAANGGDGIEVNCGACIQRISANAIYGNDGIGIDLNGGSDGVTPNDPDDADTGPNGRQNFPILDAMIFMGGSSVSGAFDSTPSTTFRVEIFASDTCDFSGNGEGKEFVGFKNDVTTDATGDATFTVSLSKFVSMGKVMTATAIAPDGSTSEFSPCTLPPPSTTSTSSSTSSSTSDASSTSSTSTSTTMASSSIPSSTTPTTTTTTSTVSTPTTTTGVSSTTGPTTSTSTSSSTSSTAATTSTTVTTTTALATTTSTQPGPCDGAVADATFVSIDCRLDQLLSDLNRSQALGTFQEKLVHNVEKATAKKLDAESLCRASNLKKTKKRLQQAATALKQYAHRLNGLAARKKLPATVRQSFLDAGAPIEQALKTLRGTVRCPDDAPPA